MTLLTWFFLVPVGPPDNVKVLKLLKHPQILRHHWVYDLLILYCFLYYVCL